MISEEQILNLSNRLKDLHKFLSIKDKEEEVSELEKKTHEDDFWEKPEEAQKILKEISKIKYETSWGKKSLFEWLSKKNARICVLGVPWNKGCSYLHRYEELNMVPWRYFKTFEGKLYQFGKKIGECREKKYSKVDVVDFFF